MRKKEEVRHERSGVNKINCQKLPLKQFRFGLLVTKQRQKSKESIEIPLYLRTITKSKVESDDGHIEMIKRDFLCSHKNNISSL